jgi:hypothetical protein
LGYVLRRGDENAADVSATFEGGAVTVIVCRKLADEWSTSDRVGITGDVHLDDGVTLQVSIEKDFACLTENRPEDQDAYPHPHPHATC